MPGVSAFLVADKPTISEALPCFSGSISAMSARGLGESASLAHHASSGPVQSTLGRVYFGTALRELRRDTTQLLASAWDPEHR